MPERERESKVSTHQLSSDDKEKNERRRGKMKRERERESINQLELISFIIIADR